MKTTIKIMGMHCASCANTIEKALKKSKGIVDANVNFAAEKATVEFDENKINQEEIEKIIEKTGYKVIKEEKESKTDEKGISEIKLKIIGMDNPHCVGTVSDALSTIKGVVSKETKALVIPTDEELMIARDTYRIASSCNFTNRV